MPKYRAYLIGEDGHIQGFEPLACDDDNAAIAAAARLVDDHDVELWQAGRMVITLDRKADPEKMVGMNLFTPVS